MPGDLSPVQLARVLATLDVASAIVIDVVRGRPISQADVAQVRQSVSAVKAVLDALDDLHPWAP